MIVVLMLVVLTVAVGNTHKLQCNSPNMMKDDSHDNPLHLYTHEGIREKMGKIRLRRNTNEAPQPGTLGNAGICSCTSFFAVISIDNKCKVRDEQHSSLLSP